MMEPYVKVAKRQQAMISHVMWRHRLTDIALQRFGIVHGSFLATKCKVGFDVQLEKGESIPLIRSFRKEKRLMPFVILSIN